MALRLAIGAGRGRLVRQLVTESLLIALACGVLGLAVGYAGMTLFRQIEIPSDLPIALAFQLDRRALVFSLIVAVGSAVLCGLVPAIQATRTDLTAVMKAADSVAPGRRHRWGRPVLVAAQVAISVVLLVVAMFSRAGACCAWCEERHAVHINTDVERFDRFRDSRARGISIPARERQRYRSGVER